MHGLCHFTRPGRDHFKKKPDAVATHAEGPGRDVEELAIRQEDGESDGGEVGSRPGVVTDHRHVRGRGQAAEPRRGKGEMRMLDARKWGFLRGGWE